MIKDPLDQKLERNKDKEVDCVSNIRIYFVTTINIDDFDCVALTERTNWCYDRLQQRESSKIVQFL